MALSPRPRNPFRSNPSTPNVTGTSVGSPTGLGQTITSPPPTISVASPQENPAQPTETRQTADDLDVGIPLEEPPPYTVRPSPMTGETILEQGPRRPFQRAPSPRARLAPAQTGGSSFSSSSTPSRRPGRSGGLLQQLTDSLNSMVDNINNSSQNNMNRRHSTGSGTPLQATPNPGWSEYPGQQTQPQMQYAPPAHPPPSSSLLIEPPPRHPSSHSFAHSSSPMTRSASSEFARDFYAAGADGSDAPRNYAPPPGPPPLPNRPPSSDFARDFYAAGAGDPEASRNSGHPPPVPPRPTQASRSNNQVPNDGSPTSFPAVGHPLLKDGKILVYPKRHECDKCHNVGYKTSDPSRPCKKCWSKYGKPFAGPLAYSFSNTTPDSNFQRPLSSIPVLAPPPRPGPIPPPISFSSPAPARFAPGGYMPNQQGGFFSPPMGVHPVGVSRPPPGAVVYTAGDPRIGGRLCWRCDGRGNTNFFLLDRITCEVCGGIGRTFN